MSSGTYILAFTGGLAFGAAGGVLGAKTYFQKKSRKEISEMRAYFVNRAKEGNEVKAELGIKSPSETLMEGEEDLADLTENVQYSEDQLTIDFDDGAKARHQAYEDLAHAYDQSETMSPKGPYEITEDQYGEWDDYEQITLYYWNNRILTDDHNEPVTDIVELLGTLEPGRFADGDAIYIRNDRLGADYEILRKLDDFPLYKPGGGSV